MTDIRRTLPCPICSTSHLVPISRNRSRCKGCTTWLQINLTGEALQDFYAAKDKASIDKRGYILIKSNKKYF